MRSEGDVTRSDRLPGQLGVSPAKPRIVPRGLISASHWDPCDDETYRQLDISATDLRDRWLRSAVIDRSRVTRATFEGSRFDSVIFSDCLLYGCDFANLRAQSSSLMRVVVSNSRLTGARWSDGVIRDAHFTECRMEFSSFRHGKCIRVVFEDCDLRDSDFQEADLSGTAFIRCDLSRVQLSNATLEGVRFRDCNLDLAQGVEAMKGASIGVKELISLAPAMATALGIRLEAG